MKKPFLFLFATATLTLAGCGGGNPNQDAANKLAGAAILISTDGTSLSTDHTNELDYGKILYPCITYTFVASKFGVTPDVEGGTTASASLQWDFGTAFNFNSETGPDAAHGKLTQTDETKAALKKDGATPIAADIKFTITFRDAKTSGVFKCSLLPKAK